MVSCTNDFEKHPYIINGCSELFASIWGPDNGVGAVITPALRIDQEGYRMGQGGGFYDRALPILPGWKIGLVHAGELTSETLPRESHDIPLDAAATPSLIVRFKRQVDCAP